MKQPVAKVLASRSPQMQHARLVTPGQGLLGNQFIGKVELKIGNQHVSKYKRRRRISA